MASLFHQLERDQTRVNLKQMKLEKEYLKKELKIGRRELERQKIVVQEKEKVINDVQVSYRVILCSWSD